MANPVYKAFDRIVCPECDILNHVPGLAAGEKAHCRRCGCFLSAHRGRAADKILALAIAALIFLGLANLFPFLGFSSHGQGQMITLVGGVFVLATENYPVLAALVLIFILGIPAIFLLAMIYVATAIRLKMQLPGVDYILSHALRLMPWSMADIFLVGILVSFIKILALADVELGASFFAYTCFSICLLLVMIYIDRRQMWMCLKGLKLESV